jgi:UDP-arabinose 4-epimerase
MTTSAAATGISFVGAPFVLGDVHDGDTLGRTLRQFRPDGAIHFAALAYVGESVAYPAKYYANNVVGTLSLIEAGVENIVFSSSCATYGTADHSPLRDDAPTRPISPYGRGKLMAEQILSDIGHAQRGRRPP